MYGAFRIHMIFSNFFLIVLGQQRKESRNEKVSTDLCYGLTADNGKNIAILRDLESLVHNI